MDSMTEEKVTELKRLGLTAAAAVIHDASQLSDKLKVAYEKYRFLTPQAIQRFQDKLRDEMVTDKQGVKIYKQLRFTTLESYSKIPPDHVLAALMQAKDVGCFDTFEVADLETIQQFPDPLLLGCVTGCTDKFYITQWDDDVKIQDILQADEGWVK